jgi:hypothetical protein
MVLATKAGVWLVLALALVTALTRLFMTIREEPKSSRGSAKPIPGYTLVAPVLSTRTHLIDMQGQIVHTWASHYTAGQAAYLLENGHLLRAAQLPRDERLFGGPQAGGRVQEFTWDGTLVWDFKLHDATRIPHHDLARLPNGNVLLIVWEIKTAEELVAAGRSRESVDGPWLVDSILEIRPTGRTTGEVVWEWHVWDHLIQDRDPSRANYGDVAAHPERIDINFGETLLSEVTRARTPPDQEARRKARLNTLKSIGYLGAPAAQGRPAVMADWTHINAVAYDPDLDRILLTVRAFSEFWIIDHSTTSAEAKGHTGGRSQRGGDLLYRWGNPQAYRAGTAEDQQLFAPHAASWIPRGYPGAGHVLVFNNGVGRPGAEYSSVDEIVLPDAPGGHYARTPGSAYGPARPVWSYTAPNKMDFAAPLLSSAQRLPNGDTLICQGVSGTVFEVTREKKVVWKQTVPSIAAAEPVGLGPAPNRPGAAPRPQEILAAPWRDTLKLAPEQTRELAEIQHEVDTQLDKTLTEGQKARLREMDGSRAGGLGDAAAPGQIMSLSRQIVLKLTGGQQKELSELQKRVDEKLDQILTADQKARFERGKREFDRGGLAAVGPGLTAAPHSRSKNLSPAGAGSPGDFTGPLPPGINPVFCASRYGADYPGLAGKDLRPAE